MESSADIKAKEDFKAKLKADELMVRATIQSATDK